MAGKRLESLPGDPLKACFEYLQKYTDLRMNRPKAAQVYAKEIHTDFFGHCDVPKHLIHIRNGYKLQYDGFQELNQKPSEDFLQNYNAAMNSNVDKFTTDLRDILTCVEPEGEQIMNPDNEKTTEKVAKKTTKKATKKTTKKATKKTTKKATKKASGRRRGPSKKPLVQKLPRPDSAIRKKRDALVEGHQARSVIRTLRKNGYTAEAIQEAMSKNYDIKIEVRTIKNLSYGGAVMSQKCAPISEKICKKVME